MKRLSVVIWWLPWFAALVLGFSGAPEDLLFILFTMGCWAVLDVYWATASTGPRHIAAEGQDLASRRAERPGPRTIMRRMGSELSSRAFPYALYCLPLSSVPILGQRVVPHLLALEIMGASMCAFGVAFAIWARHSLAGSWNAAVTLGEGHSLVQHGPYAIVRHPIYLGFLVALAGMSLVLGEVRGLILSYGVLDVLLKKVSQEESILRVAFPGRYPRYERRVKQLIPWIW